MDRKLFFQAIGKFALGVLALGLGMSCILVWDRFIPGILIGVAGMAGVVAAWPVYQWIENKK